MIKFSLLKFFVVGLVVAYLSCGVIFAQSVSSSSPSEIADDGVPVLIKNLPDWETVREQAIFVKTLPELEKATGKNPALEVINFNAAEAVVAPYEAGKLAIIEFSTPQFAFDNDAKILAKLDEIKQKGQITPIYRKVGNYAVFVFDTKDEASANNLIDQVKYEKVVQWLGEDPYRQERAEKYYVSTMGDVIATVVRASGFALLAAIGLGGIFGAWIFYSRRKEQLNSFSDAGGMTRLNLDDLTSSSENDKLLKD